MDGRNHNASSSCRFQGTAIFFLVVRASFVVVSDTESLGIRQRNSAGIDAKETGHFDKELNLGRPL
jgi:hypothetical protein